MAIENNYDGPPSLKIYQEFVVASSADSGSQNAVIVAEHFDVFKATGNLEDDYEEYKAGTASNISWEDLDSNFESVDKKSVKLLFENAYVSQYETTGTVSGNEVTLTKAVDSADIPEPVVVGDMVSVKGTIARIIAIAESPDTTPTSITTVPGYTNASTAAAFTLGGVYQADSDRIYYLNIVSVEEGETTKKVVVDVSTADGTDAGLCEITDSEVVKIANSGLTVSVKTWGFKVGDYYQIDAKKTATGTRNVLILDTNVATTKSTSATVQLGKPRTFYASIDQYSVTETGVSIVDNLKANVSFGGNAEADYPVIFGNFYVERRARSDKYNGRLGLIDNSNLSEVGYIGVENPLGVMVATALKGGVAVYCTSVTADTRAAYSKAFSFLTRSTNTYGIVIGSLKQEVIAEAASFVSQLEDPDVANYKIVYYGLDNSSDVSILSTTPSGSKIIATIKNGEVTLGSTGVGFKTSGIKAGDKLRINYTTDDMGVVAYDNEFTVDYVVSDTVLRLTNTKVDVPVGKVFEIWRTLDGQDLVDALKNRVYTNNHRCYCVFGDGINVDGTANAPAWLLAALPAGMRAGEYCQRPISNLSYDGCTAMNKLSLNAAELKDLASRGVWILANNTDGSSVYNYHQISTDMSDKKLQEQSYTTNFDDISRGARSLMLPYYGNSNISEDFLNQIYADLAAFLGSKTTNAPSTAIGPQLIRYENLTLEQDEVNRDRVYMDVDYYMPAPFNHVVFRQRLI